MLAMHRDKPRAIGKTIIGAAADLGLHFRVDDTRGDARDAQARRFVAHDTTCVMIERGLGCAVHAPSGVRLAAGTARDVEDASVIADGDSRECGGEGERRADVEHHGARYGIGVLRLQWADRLQRAGVVHQHGMRRVANEPRERIATEPVIERAGVAQVERDLLQCGKAAGESFIVLTRDAEDARSARQELVGDGFADAA